MPEVSDPTHLSEHNVVIIERSSIIFDKRILVANQLCLVRWEGAAEGGADDWGEVVTR